MSYVFFFFYYISEGLMRSTSHGDVSMMDGVLPINQLITLLNVLSWFFRFWFAILIVCFFQFVYNTYIGFFHASLVSVQLGKKYYFVFRTLSYICCSHVMFQLLPRLETCDV